MNHTHSPFAEVLRMLEIPSISTGGIVQYIVTASAEARIPVHEQERLVGYVCLQRKFFGVHAAYPVDDGDGEDVGIERSF